MTSAPSAALSPTLSLLVGRLAPAADPDALSRLRAARASLPLSIGGRNASLTLTNPEVPDAAVHLSVGGTGLALPADLVEWLLQPLGLAGPPADPTQRAMLLELALIDLLPLAEDLLGQPLRLEPATATAPHVGLRIDTPDGIFLAGLVPADPETLADLLDEAAPPEGPDPAGLTAAVSIRLGRQALTPDEVAGLRPGDTIMLEPGPALAVAERDVAAALDLDPRGLLLRSEFLPVPVPTPVDGMVDLHAEIAQARMTLGTLQALRPGDPLPLAAFDDMPTELRIGDTIIGRGERVQIGTGTGIRILSLATGTP